MSIPQKDWTIEEILVERDRLFERIMHTVVEPNFPVGRDIRSLDLVNILWAHHSTCCRQVESMRDANAIRFSKEHLEHLLSDLSTAMDDPDNSRVLLSCWIDRIEDMLAKFDPS